MSNRPKTYGEFKADNNIRNKTEYLDKVAELTASAKRASGGTVMSTLSADGLEGSGYAAHIRSGIERELEKSKEQAYLGYMEKEAEATEAYGAHLDSYQLLQNAETDKIIEHLKENRIFTAEGALSVVKESSLSVEGAMDVLTRGVYMARRKAIDEATEHAVSRYYSFYDARRYALAIGLLPEDAYEVAMNTYNYSYDDVELQKIYGSESYLGYLQDKLMKSKYEE